MKEVEVTQIAYVAADGKQFNSRSEAEKYEGLLAVLEKLQKYAVDGPKFTPYDGIRLRSYEWQWFKVNNADELDELMLGLQSYGAFWCKGSLSGVRGTCKFPEYICYSNSFHEINCLTDLQARHEKEMKCWDEFIRFFDVGDAQCF